MKKLLKILLSVLLFLVLLVGVYYGYSVLTGNVRTVIPGAVYRSAQLSPSQLQALIDREHIKSIIDLAPDDPARGPEMIVSQKNHVRHYDLQLHAYTYPSTAELLQLSTLLQTAPRPLLVHCYSGVDRTGLASAMVLALTPGVSEYRIKMQYSWLFFALRPASIGKPVMGNYFYYLEQHHERTTPELFKLWLKSSSAEGFVQTVR